MQRCLIVVLALLSSAPVLARSVPAPQVGKVRQLLRNIRGKIKTRAMVDRIRRARLAPPIERLLLHNVSRIAANGARYGTFDLYGHRDYHRVEAVGQHHRRSVSSDRDTYHNTKARSFGLTLGRVGAEGKTASYIALTRNVTIAEVGDRRPVAIEHKNGKVTQRLRLKKGPDRWNLGRAKELLEQGGLTLTQAMQKAQLVE